MYTKGVVRCHVDFFMFDLTPGRESLVESVVKLVTNELAAHACNQHRVQPKSMDKLTPPTVL